MCIIRIISDLTFVLEILSAALKNDPQVSGVTLNGSEYLLGQYADDSALILGDENNFS